MKKTLTVNLGGTVYHIDEDAYMLLDKYLLNLEQYFRKEEGAEEIVKDIEMRISELFSTKVSNGFQVINISDVEEIIARVGKPEEFSEEQKTENKFAGESKKNTSDTGERKFNENIRHKLYRNSDDKILGGVAGGISAYMGWDSTWVRLFLILLLFIPYLPVVWVYLIAWILIPQAVTAAEKLSMRGENVTVENIGKTVTEGFEKVAGDVNDYINSGKPRSTLNKLGDLFVQVVGAILKVLMIIFTVILSPVLFVLIIVFVVLIFAGVGILGASPLIFMQHINPAIDFSGVEALPATLIGVSGVLLFGIPLFALLHTLFRTVFHWKPMAAGWKWALVIIWSLSAVGFFILRSAHLGWIWNAPVHDWMMFAG